MSTIDGFEVSDLPFDWSSIDQKALNEGYRYFWNSCQITGFKRDKNGNYVRDEDGNLIAHRTDKQRTMDDTWFNFKSENNYE